MERHLIEQMEEELPLLQLEYDSEDEVQIKEIAEQPVGGFPFLDQIPSSTKSLPRPNPYLDQILKMVEEGILVDVRIWSR